MNDIDFASYDSDCKAIEEHLRTTKKNIEANCRLAARSFFVAFPRRFRLLLCDARFAIDRAISIVSLGRFYDRKIQEAIDKMNPQQGISIDQMGNMIIFQSMLEETIRRRDHAEGRIDSLVQQNKELREAIQSFLQPPTTNKEIVFKEWYLGLTHKHAGLMEPR